MELLVNLIPIVIILSVLLWRKHMLFAGLLGAVSAMLIGQIAPGDAVGLVTGGISTMFSYISPILYAAAAVMVSQAGCFNAIVSIAQEKLKNKMFLFAAFMVLIQALATYMAGMGAGNTMVIAPLVFAAVGAIPAVIAGMAIATAACFTTSPASTETVLAAEAAAVDVGEHAAAMLPLTLLLVLLGAALAAWGVYKKGGLLTEKAAAKDAAAKGEAIAHPGVRMIPAAALLVMVIFGGKLNGLLGVSIFSPVMNVLITAVLTAALTPLGINKTCDALGEGSKYILTTLFSVGIFLGFINIIAELGTFEQLAALVGRAPQGVIVPCAIVMAFLIAIPSGAMCAGVLALILPTMSLLGMPSVAMGLVAVAAGLGTQVSPVQINIAALSDGFGVDIMTIVRDNMKFVLGALAVLIAASFIFV